MWASFCRRGRYDSASRGQRVAGPARSGKGSGGMPQPCRHRPGVGVVAKLLQGVAGRQPDQLMVGLDLGPGVQRQPLCDPETADVVERLTVRTTEILARLRDPGAPPPRHAGPLEELPAKS